MRRIIQTLALAAGAVLVFGSTGKAAALHGYCGGSAQCVDNGTNSPTSNNPPTDFGFTASPSTAGDFLVNFLLPNNLVSNPSALSFSLTGTLTGTAGLFSSSAWGSGNLSTFLGLPGASPANPIGAYLPAAQALDPGATGFYVYQVDLGTTTLLGPSSPNTSLLENISEVLPIGSYIVGDLSQEDCKTKKKVTTCTTSWIETANSGAILVTSDDSSGNGGSTVPEPATLTLLGSSLLGLGALSRRHTRR